MTRITDSVLMPVTSAEESIKKIFAPFDRELAKFRQLVSTMEDRKTALKKDNARLVGKR